jgi:hypothetical protein
MGYGRGVPVAHHRVAVHDDDHSPDVPHHDEVLRAARRTVAFEEILRGATALMAVLFSVSFVASFPMVPEWLFPVVLGGVVLSVPAAIFVRSRQLDPEEQRSAESLWTAALLGVGVLAVVLALLLVVGRTTDLATALTRLAGTIGTLTAVAWFRGWRPPATRPVEADRRWAPHEEDR